MPQGYDILRWHASIITENMLVSEMYVYIACYIAIYNNEEPGSLQFVLVIQDPSI